ncbi:P27 family phage terminase small subunit [Facklamia sp. P9177]|uniref:P27 family phage terminase small subunit n=1 Tax=Facklamia sp. P9177 TaxID=3421945 RepID=UPI003D165F58
MVKKKIVDRIREDLHQYLEDAGVYGEHFFNLVDDYCRLYEIKEMLWKDIQERGVAVEWQNSETSRGVKKNESVGEYNKVNSQMMNILKQLGITSETLRMLGGEDDAEEF